MLCVWPCAIPVTWTNVVSFLACQGRDTAESRALLLLLVVVFGSQDADAPEPGVLAEPEVPKLGTASDSKHQSASDQHGHQVEIYHGVVQGGMQLKCAREMVQNDVEVIVHDGLLGLDVAQVAPAPHPAGAAPRARRVDLDVRGHDDGDMAKHDPRVEPHLQRRRPDDGGEGRGGERRGDQVKRNRNEAEFRN